ncbi:MAG: SDR family oxidoreductase [Acidiferrobacterales bacterium]|nr:SDR family oxidoreductase [Acidiferrobacterales bacterium]
MTDPLVSANRLSVSYRIPKTLPWEEQQYFEVLKEVNFEILPGQRLGIVGESGSGKTTLGRAMLRLVKLSSGQLLFDGENISTLKQSALRPMRQRMQMIFQDPQSSLNPRRRIANIVTQPLIAFGKLPDRSALRETASTLLERVGLNPDLIDRFPHELSGGQRQRVGIARAIALEPKLLVADEIVSGLDVSSQAQIILLLESLSRDMDLTLVFISHDLSVVRKLCDSVIVLHQGRIAERNSTDGLFRFARHPYTRELIRAIPLPEIDDNWLDQNNDTQSKGGLAMQIKNATVLVTGANRGIGRAYIDELVKRGAKKVYATARTPSEIKTSHANVETHPLDITDRDAVYQLASKLSDVDLIINNAGVNMMSALVASDGLDAARAEMEVNYLGTLSMCQAFAPVLKENGGGAILNMLSILSRVNLPLMGSLCASKAAGLSLVQGVRAELAAQNTAVVAVMPGAVDTDMSKDFPPPKMAPADVVSAALDGLEEGLEEIYPGEMASGLNQGLSADPKAVEKELAGYLPG